MRHRRSVVALGLFLVSAAAARADRFWALQLRCGSVILSADAPEERDGLLLFHRHPGREFSSVRASEVRRITIAEGPPKKPRRSLDGEVMVFGRDADPPDWRDRPARVRIMSRPREDSDAPLEPYGYGYGYGGYPIPAPPPPVRPDRVPPLVRPNGFPSLPPGVPGSAPPPIGPNGFPVLTITPPPMDVPPPPPMRRPR